MAAFSLSSHGLSSVGAQRVSVCSLMAAAGYPEWPLPSGRQQRQERLWGQQWVSRPVSQRQLMPCLHPCVAAWYPLPGPWSPMAALTCRHCREGTGRKQSWTREDAVLHGAGRSQGQAGAPPEPASLEATAIGPGWATRDRAERGPVRTCSPHPRLPGGCGQGCLPIAQSRPEPCSPGAGPGHL